MRGLSIPGIMMVTTIGVVGLIVILMSSTGFTPVYYHSLPEVQFIDLFSTYFYTEVNIKRTIENASEKFFSNIDTYPMEWENWDTFNSFKIDFENEFAKKLAKLAEDYFSSVSEIGYTSIKLRTLASKITYHHMTPTLNWNYTYEISLQRKLYGTKVAHEINTTLKLDNIRFEFTDLQKTYNCTNCFYDILWGVDGVAGLSYSFFKADKYLIEKDLRNRVFRNISISPPCNNFCDIVKDLKVELDCKTSCSCESVNKAKVILYLKEDNKPGLAFTGEFNNFSCGVGPKECTTGLDCLAKDCIDGICGNCWFGSLGDRCSPAGNSISMDNFRCYETLSGAYRCVKAYPNIQYFLNGKKVEPSMEINLNCGSLNSNIGNLNNAKFEVLGPNNYIIKFNGMTIINPSNLDLCNITQIPRTNGKLEIYANFSGDYYKVGEIVVNFELSNFITNLNKVLTELEPVKFNNLDCATYKSKIRNYFRDHMGNLEGYNFSMSINSVCNTGELTTPAREKYASIEVTVKEQSTDKKITILYYIIELTYED